MQRNNVTLITETVTRIEADHIHSDGEKKTAVDAIILGTGFEATEFLSTLHVRGKSQRDLNHV